MAQGDGTVGRLKGFVEQCMSKYDLDGWMARDLVAPNDVNVLAG